MQDGVSEGNRCEVLVRLRSMDMVAEVGKDDVA